MLEQPSNQIIELTPSQAINDNSGENRFSYLYYLKVCFWSKFFCFRGRARRKEYLTFQITDLLIACLFYGLLHYTTLSNEILHQTYMGISTVLIIPLMSVTVRRLHDTGFSGWWCALGVIPYVLMICLAVKDSDANANKYGDIPLGKTFKPSILARIMANKGQKVSAQVVHFDDQDATHQSDQEAA